jgi:hypothetical protein
MASEGDEWRKKWEKSEDNLQKLKKLAHKGRREHVFERTGISQVCEEKNCEFASKPVI